MQAAKHWMFHDNNVISTKKVSHAGFSLIPYESLHSQMSASWFLPVKKEQGEQ